MRPADRRGTAVRRRSWLVLLVVAPAPRQIVDVGNQPEYASGESDADGCANDVYQLAPLSVGMSSTLFGVSFFTSANAVNAKAAPAVLKGNGLWL